MKEHSKMVHGANTSGFAARILVSIFRRNIHQFDSFSAVAKDVELNTVIKNCFLYIIFVTIEITYYNTSYKQTIKWISIFRIQIRINKTKLCYIIHRKWKEDRVMLTVFYIIFCSLLSLNRMSFTLFIMKTILII